VMGPVPFIALGNLRCDLGKMRMPLGRDGRKKGTNSAGTIAELWQLG